MLGYVDSQHAGTGAERSVASEGVFYSLDYLVTSYLVAVFIEIIPFSVYGLPSGLFVFHIFIFSIEYVVFIVVSHYRKNIFAICGFHI